VAASKSDKGRLLNYNIQPFTRQFFDAISSVQLLALKTGLSFSLYNFYDDMHISAVYYVFNPP